MRRLRTGGESVSEVCRRFRVSRPTAYRWRERYRAGKLAGLQDRSHRPARVPARTDRRWLERLRRLRKCRPTWGARKLRPTLGKQYGQAGLPAVATLSRWLQRWGLARGRKRKPPGPVVVRRAVRPARRCHEVWTVDFKGWYRTGDGRRVDPLTVRDLHSRYVLRIGLLTGQGLAPTRREFVRLFREHGLPERIRCENGAPFGGGGPTGLTRLSAWWIRLGIAVEFLTPGRPCENGAHEQFHRVYKAEVARRPAWNRAAQQRRSTRWRRDYNQERPHEGLAMETPASRYRKNGRRLPRRLLPWDYPAGWERRWVRGNGELNWRGNRRYVGEAFVGAHVGLKPVRRGVWRVHFGPMLVGELHDAERGGLRLARHRHRQRARRAGGGSARSARDRKSVV